MQYYAVHLSHTELLIVELVLIISPVAVSATTAMDEFFAVSGGEVNTGIFVSAAAISRKTIRCRCLDRRFNL